MVVDVTMGRYLNADRRNLIRRCHALADEALDGGLSDDERHELTEMLLKTDEASWAKLTNDQLQALVYALHGHHLIETLRALRSPQRVEARVVGGEVDSGHEEFEESATPMLGERVDGLVLDHLRDEIVEQADVLARRGVAGRRDLQSLHHVLGFGGFDGGANGE